MNGEGNFSAMASGSATVPLEPAAPQAIRRVSGVWPAPAVRMPPALVKSSQMAPGRILLPEPFQSYSIAPMTAPITSGLARGTMPSSSSAARPIARSFATAEGKSQSRTVERMFSLRMK